MRVSGLVIVFVIALMAIATSLWAAPGYYFQVISENTAMNLNDKGTLVSCGYKGSNRGYVTDVTGGKVIDLGPNTWVTDINNLGMSVGQKGQNAYLFSKNGTPMRIGQANAYSVAYAINDRCAIAGGVLISFGGWYGVVFPFLYQGRMYILSSEPGTAVAVSNPIDPKDPGVVGGFIYRSNPDRTVPVLWEWEKTKGKYIQNDLPVPTGTQDGYITHIDGYGQPVGYVVMADNSKKAVEWYREGSNWRVIYLHQPSSDENNWALSSNDSGQVVGYTETTACLWMDKRLYDLNSSLIPIGCEYRLSVAVAINQGGQILCRAYNLAGRNAMILLSPLN